MSRKILNKDWLPFLESLGTHWAWAAGSTVIAVVAAFLQEVGLVVPHWILWAFAASGLLIAAFLAWRDQYLLVKQKDSEIDALSRSKASEEPKLVFSTSETKNKSGGGRPAGQNKVFNIDVTLAAGPPTLYRCQGRLKEIRHAGKTIWEGRNKTLAFAPSEAGDCESKSISLNATEHLDVLFIEPIHGAKRWELLIGTKNRAWELHPSLDEIFNTSGEYILVVEFVADGMEAKTVQVRFDLRDDVWVSTLMICI